MSHPCLLFCPYIPLRGMPGIKFPIVFADWELGPLESFNGRWADPLLKERASMLLGIVRPRQKSIET